VTNTSSSSAGLSAQCEALRWLARAGEPGADSGSRSLVSQMSLERHLPEMKEESRLSDCELLWSARSDPEAFGVFYRRHAVGLERWLRSQTPDIATAADLTAETFAQALVGLERFRGDEEGAAHAWIYGIARNLVRRYHRRGRVEMATCRKLGIQVDLDPQEIADLEQRMQAMAHASELSQALDALPSAQREAVQLRIIDELDYPEAAIRMGTSEQNARMRVSRALRTLQQRFQGAI
jgi:RNA polymerase sigma factor (sigma-70 family)